MFKRKYLDNLDFIYDLKCKKLENILLRNNFIVNYKPLEIFKKSIKRFILRGNPISEIKGLKEFMEKFEQLNELVLSDNKIDLNIMKMLKFLNK